MGLRAGDISRPLIEPDLLVGGEVPGPWEETGERMGDGARIDVSPAR